MISSSRPMQKILIHDDQEEVVGLQESVYTIVYAETFIDPLTNSYAERTITIGVLDYAGFVEAGSREPSVYENTTLIFGPPIVYRNIYVNGELAEEFHTYSWTATVIAPPISAATALALGYPLYTDYPEFISGEQSLSIDSLSLIETDVDQHSTGFTVRASRHRDDDYEIVIRIAEEDSPVLFDGGTSREVTVIMRAGQTSVRVPFTLLGDQRPELTQNLTIIAEAAVGTAQGRLTVSDDDMVVMSISPDAVRVTEGQAVDVTVTFAVPASYPVTLNLSAVEAGALLELDFPVTVEIPANSTSYTFQVAGRADNELEYFGENATIAIRAAGVGIGALPINLSVEDASLEVLLIDRAMGGLDGGAVEQGTAKANAFLEWRGPAIEILKGNADDFFTSAAGIVTSLAGVALEYGSIRATYIEDMRVAGSDPELQYAARLKAYVETGNAAAKTIFSAVPAGVAMGFVSAFIGATAPAWLAVAAPVAIGAGVALGVKILWDSHFAETAKGILIEEYQSREPSPPAVPMTLSGTMGDDYHSGGGAGDSFFLQQGGVDRASGGGGRDGFFFGAALTELDVVDGGPDVDTLAIKGNYPSLVLGDIRDVEILALLSGSDASLPSGIKPVAEGIILPDGSPSVAPLFGYNIRTIDSNVAAGALFRVVATGLLPGENLVFDGSAETNGKIHIYAGQGIDNLTGGAGMDGFLFGADWNLTGADRINGGGGIDSVALRGDYVGERIVRFQEGSLTNIETIVLLSGHTNEYGGLIDADGFDYIVVAHDSSLAAGQRMDVIGTTLRADEHMIFDGEAETNGLFRIFGGAGDDQLYGGQGNDVIYGGMGYDFLEGYGGADVFVYRSAAEASGYTGRDVIFTFDPTTDRLDLPFEVGAISREFSAILNVEGFDATLEGALASLRPYEAALFTPAAGGIFVSAMVIIDANGVPGYQTGQDYLIQMRDPAIPLGPGMDFFI